MITSTRTAKTDGRNPTFRDGQSQWPLVCTAAGFSDISYFNRAFRARFGARPTDVRSSFEHERRDPALPPAAADEPASG
jgi:methylphosphotriester-DNA--protein-cysteine methyltransferase